MPAGGLIGESKGDILDAVGLREFVARYHRLRGDTGNGEALSAIRTFMQSEQLTYPIVLKPDCGQRGEGVRVAHCERDVRTYLERIPGDLIVQEHIPGPEYGIFYYRLPGEERGQIFSVTEKYMPTITGDGVHTLEDLVCLDRRAACQEKAYHHANRDRWQEVIPAGKTVPLVEIGTHCRGAIFLDGEREVTEALAESNDRNSPSYPGFYFGRLDVRCLDGQSIGAGSGYRVLEINGVTSEATHIYDPKYNVWHAYRVLFRQWSLAFDIGRRNHRRGAVPTSPRGIWTQFRQFERVPEA
jgi:hypothetical protein